LLDREVLVLSGIPIIDKTNKLIGILTNRDLRFETGVNRSVREVMTTENLITAPVGTTLEQAKEILQKHKIEKLPVVEGDNQLVGLITYKDIMKVEDYPNSCKDSLGRLVVGAAVGVTNDLMDRVSALVDVDVDVVCVDTAHGHSAGVLNAIKMVKQKYPDLEIVGGNVATGAGAKALVEAGVNGVKVGVGPGSICTTRVVAGIGIPQLQAVIDCAQVCKENEVPFIADGGIKYSGDIVKALAAGASSVMIGSLFAGTDEAPGERVLFQGRAFKVYRGMGSLESMKKGSRDRYAQYGVKDKKLVPEGIEGQVPYRGRLKENIFQILGGIKSGMGYIGARDLVELNQKAIFRKISGASLKESHPHDVQITKEAPNYRG